jgi:ribA/ribD-fused uncharacterized protein
MRRENLRFNGFPEYVQEDQQHQPKYESTEMCEKLVQDFLGEFLDIRPVAIERCHRLGPKNNRSGRPIIVKFSQYKEREYVWQSKKHLKGKDTNIIIHEDFPPEVAARVKIMMPIFLRAIELKRENQRIKWSVRLVADTLYLAGSKYTVENLSHLPPILQPENVATRYDENTNTLCFWGENAVWSNFYNSEFQEEGIVFNCVEQYYCAGKAKQFEDPNALQAIMKEKNPAIQKGIKVKNFNTEDWLETASEVMKRGVKLKFEQNSVLREKLLKTGKDELVEASKNDNYWGIGISLKDPKLMHRSLWGKNNLGLILQAVRREITDE